MKYINRSAKTSILIWTEYILSFLDSWGTFGHVNLTQMFRYFPQRILVLREANGEIKPRLIHQYYGENINFNMIKEYFMISWSIGNFWTDKLNKKYDFHMNNVDITNPAMNVHLKITFWRFIAMHNIFDYEMSDRFPIGQNSKGVIFWEN